jgi:NADH dehydrogenase FAD-containing subunit
MPARPFTYETEHLGVRLVNPVRCITLVGDMSVPGHPEVLAVEDVAAALWKDNRMVPRLMPAADQMGRLAAKKLLQTLKG